MTNQRFQLTTQKGRGKRKKTRYLAKILEVGSEHILNIWWVRSINLIPEGPKKLVCFMLSSEVSHVIM